MESKFKLRKLERLSETLKELQTELGKTLQDSEATETDIDIIVAKIKELEEEKKDVRKLNRLKVVNKNHEEKRELLRELLSVELPKEDITTNEGKFHAVKVKKYPSLVAFMERYQYARFIFRDGIYNRVEIGRDSYTLKQPKHQYGKETEYNEFESFEDALKFNGIQAKPMTFKQFKTLEAKILKESKRIEEEVSKSYEKMKGFNAYFLENEGLITRRSATGYYNYYSI